MILSPSHVDMAGLVVEGMSDKPDDTHYTDKNCCRDTYRIVNIRKKKENAVNIPVIDKTMVAPMRSEDSCAVGGAAAISSPQ
jgi:hypothetical protein